MHTLKVMGLDMGSIYGWRRRAILLPEAKIWELLQEGKNIVIYKGKKLSNISQLCLTSPYLIV